MSALLTLALVLAAPAEDPAATAPEDPAPSSAPSEAAETEASPSPSPGPGTETATATEAEASPEPPPPSLGPAGVRNVSPAPAPGPSNPTPGFGQISTTPAPEAEPDDYDLRGSDMPYGANAARKSADRRNNDVLVRPFRRPVYSVTAAARFGTLVAGGAEVVQPFGYGFAAQLRIHFAAVVKSRFGVEIHAGHTRFSQRRDYPTIDDASITRITLLTDTDFSAGPSLEIPLGPVFVQFGGSAGVALSTLFRPRSADSIEDEQISASNFMVRGGASVGIPILNRHGLSLGAGVHHIFSQRDVEIDPLLADSPTTRPFGTWVEVFGGYQIWF